MNAYLSTAKEYRNLERQIALGSKPSAFRRLFGGAKAKVQSLSNMMYARKKLAPINYKLSIAWRQHLMNLLRKQQAAQQKVENLKRSWMSVRIRARTTNNISNFKSKLNDAQRNLEEAKRKVKNARKQKVLTIESTEYTKKGMTPTVSAVKRANMVANRAKRNVKNARKQKVLTIESMEYTKKGMTPTVSAVKRANMVANRANAVRARVAAPLNNKNEFHNALESHPLVNNPLFNNNNNFHNASQNFNNNKVYPLPLAGNAQLKAYPLPLAVKVANNAATTRAKLLLGEAVSRSNSLLKEAAPRSSGLLRVAGEPAAKTRSERFFNSKRAANARRAARRNEARINKGVFPTRGNISGR